MTRVCPDCGGPRKHTSVVCMACEYRRRAVRRAAQFEATFWTKVDRSAGPDACWPWTAGRDSQGYGSTRLNGVQDRAHRVALALDGRPVPSGMYGCHRCDNPSCCNPAHLYVGSVSQNVVDMYTRSGRRGSITPAVVLDIRARREAGEPCSAIAESLGRSRTFVWAVATRRSWRFVA